MIAIIQGESSGKDGRQANFTSPFMGEVKKETAILFLNKADPQEIRYHVTLFR